MLIMLMTIGPSLIPHRREDALRAYQFPVETRVITTKVWTSIQLAGTTLDGLHRRIQAAMGWTNSHLHEFLLDGERYGDPKLLSESPEEVNYHNSKHVRLSHLFGGDDKVRFEYVYDFGDYWQHVVTYE